MNFFLICVFLTLNVFAFVTSEGCSSGTGVKGKCVHFKKCSRDKVLDYTRGTKYPKRCSNLIHDCCDPSGVRRDESEVLYYIPKGTPECGGGKGFKVSLFECPASYVIPENNYGSGVVKVRGDASEKFCCKKEAFTENGAIHCKNGTGTCLPYYQCPSEAVTLIDKRFDTNSTEIKQCPDYWMECCTEEATTTVAPKPRTEACGHRNKKGVPGVPAHIIPTESQFGEFPWMVAIFYDNGHGELVFKCGGSLIAPNTVLTVAHCVDKLKLDIFGIVIRLGEWDTKRTSELLKHEDFFVQTIIIHEGYETTAALNDVALLILTDEASINQQHIGTVCLPPKNMIFNHKKCVVNGWGKDLNDPKKQYAEILKKIELPIVPRSECEQKLRTTKLGSTFMLHESFVCAGGELGVDSCEGDGGSPLVCEAQNGRYYQVGIVSWGIDCGTEVPGVYVDTAHMREWIDMKLKERGISQNHYLM